MSFEWLNRFQQDMQKTQDYASKTLAAYRLGIRAKGSIAGVRIIVDENGCDACRKLDAGAVYTPDDAPHVPLEECDRPRKCTCVYRPVMSYEIKRDDE